MLQKYYNDLMDKAEKQIDKKCETCLDYIVCWGQDTLQDKACKNWKPDFMSMQNELEKLEASTAEEQNSP